MRRAGLLAAPPVEPERQRRQDREDERRLLGQEGRQRGNRGERAPAAHEREQSGEDQHRGQEIGGGGEPERGRQVLRRQEHERRGADRDVARTPERAQETTEQDGGGRVQRERRGTEQRHAPHAAERPPEQHPERPVVLPPVQIPDERQERIADVPREGQEEVVVAEEGRRCEKWHGGDDRGSAQPERGQPPRAPHGARRAISSARRRSSGVLRLTKESPSGSSGASSPPVSQTVALSSSSS